MSVLGELQGGKSVYGSVEWRYPNLLGPVQLEDELNTRLEQSAEDTGEDKKGDTN